jgi:CRP-like cAMP-binding protein
MLQKQRGKMMKKYVDILKTCPLFRDISPQEILSMLKCLSARMLGYQKNEYVLQAGDAVTWVGIVLSGGVHVVQEDFWGNRTILTRSGPGEVFAEAFSCAEIDRLPVSVVASEKVEVLQIDYQRIITTCSPVCVFHAKLIENMLRIIAQNNILLTQKAEHLAQRNTRSKLLSYLAAQAKQHKNNAFEIPFDRQELADYLCVDRSAMSKELGRMRDEGILRFEKNRFVLLDV